MVKAILLDTTYLLPIFGVRIGLPRFEECFPKLLTKHTVLYNPLSIVEAKWIALRLAKRMGRIVLDRFRLGLKALQNDDRLRPTEVTSYEIEEIADSLIPYLSDYFDRIILSTAYVHGYALLTEDEEIVNVVRKGIVSLELLKWSDILNTTC